MIKYFISFLPILLFAEESVTIKYLNGVIKKTSIHSNTNLKVIYNEIQIVDINGLSKTSFDNGKTCKLSKFQKCY
jgi:hypothetical protein